MVQLSDIQNFWVEAHCRLYGPLLAKSCLCILNCSFHCHSFLSKKQASFNYVAAVTVPRDFGAEEEEICCCLHSLPFLFAIKWGDQMPWSSRFQMLSFRPAFPVSSFTVINRLFHSSSLSSIKAVSSAYLRLLIFLPAIFIPAWHLAWCTLAWKIPWMEEPGGLQFMGSQRIRHDWATSLTHSTHSLCM